MGFDRLCQRRVGGLIGRRVAEKGVSSEGIKVGAPFALDLLRRTHCFGGLWAFMR